MNANFRVQNSEIRSQKSEVRSQADLRPQTSDLYARTSDLRPLTSARRLRRRAGVVLLIVVSLLALFVLLGITYTLSVNQYLTASKLDVQDQQKGDPAEVEADQVFGMILYDTQARTVLQYQSLLRDLYGYDVNVVSNLTTNPNGIPQYRETLQGM